MGKPQSPAVPERFLDLRNAHVRIVMSADMLDLKGGDVLFWFQVKTGDKRYANFALTGAPLLRSEKYFSHPGFEISIHLTTDEAAWTCLGSSEARADTYGCDISLTDALRSVNNDFGLIIFPVVGDPDLEKQPTGELSINSIEIYRTGNLM